MIILKSKSEFISQLIREGYSKREFARKNGISEATLIQISNGKQSPRPATAKKICDALGCKFDDIFLIEKEMIEQEV
ncbi:helix-turn-helix transcriptional regulator [Luteimonas abyssi]|uniref:helix-turn-helix transcriptional regulator n=1 Tax=Luteimonas abyssi TaxID=1247514 RepID=UPI0009E9CE56|nr:helix-turn-helix transcriptional regulator [Luteimonas abyssi]